MEKTLFNLSALFSAYNYAKNWARKNPDTEPAYADRALGMIMSGKYDEKIEQYSTTKDRCFCPTRHVPVGKHRVMVMIRIKHDQLMIASGCWRKAA